MVPWRVGSHGLGEREGYLEVQQPRQQGLPSMRCVVQQVLPLDDVDDLGQQQVLGRVPQPGVEDPVWLERGPGCWKGSYTGTPCRGPTSFRQVSVLGGEKPDQRASTKAQEGNMRHLTETAATVRETKSVHALDNPSVLGQPQQLALNYL